MVSNPKENAGFFISAALAWLILQAIFYLQHLQECQQSGFDRCTRRVRQALPSGPRCLGDEYSGQGLRYLRHRCFICNSVDGLLVVLTRPVQEQSLKPFMCWFSSINACWIA